MWAFEGGFPDGSLSMLGNTLFADLWKHLEAYGYRRGHGDGALGLALGL